MPRRIAPAPAPSKSMSVSKPSSVQTIQVQQPSLGESIKSGFGFGLGSSIAHNIFGSRPAQAPAQSAPMTEPTKLTSYEQCLVDTHGDLTGCKHLRASAMVTADINK
jgi:hypothetical protein